jgi:hypothetical protein
MKPFIYENIRTKHRACATHVTRDEFQLSTLEADLSPNSRALWGALTRSPGTDPPEDSEVLTPLQKVCVFGESSPFLEVGRAGVLEW